MLAAEQIRTGSKLYGSLDNKRLEISESKASRVVRRCLQLSRKSLF